MVEPSDECSAELKEFISVFLKQRGLSDKTFDCRAIAGNGSKRRFWRISPRTDSTTYVTMENPPHDDLSARENYAYLMIGKHLFSKGLPVPQIYRASVERGFFILEDMGGESLQEKALNSDQRLLLYEKAVQILFRLQLEGAKGFDTAWTCQTERYDRVVMRRYESDYFCDAFLASYHGLKERLPELEGAFDYLADMGEKAGADFFLHRDFQSRNIIVSGEKIGILDWQGGRLGPLAYDLASLIIDPYTELSGSEKKQVYEAYISLLQENKPSMVHSFEISYPYLAIQRNLQILGAFAFLSKRQGKAYFEAYIPPALGSLKSLVKNLGDKKLSPLMEFLDTLQT